MREYHPEAVKETSRLLFLFFLAFSGRRDRETGESDRTGRQESGDEGDGRGRQETGEDDRRGGEGDGTGGQDGETGEGDGQSDRTGRRARRRERGRDRVFQYFTIRAAAKSGGVGALRFRA